MEYPGYAANVGAPNESDILKTALANYDALIAKGITPENIIIFGHSMGAASAVHVAKNRESARASLRLTLPIHASHEPLTNAVFSKLISSKRHI